MSADQFCGRCSGFIPAPGRVYGYVGKFCMCGQGHVEQNKPLHDALKRIVDSQPAPNPPAALPTMSADHFVIWLRGYLASTGGECLTKGDFKTIAAKLDTVGGPK